MTTLNPRMQALAVDSLQTGLARLDQTLGISNSEMESGFDPDLYPQGALVAVQTNSGAVTALVGGRDYMVTEYNRAVQNQRLPGSGFKPFLYYTAFEKLGLNPSDVFEDRKITIAVNGAPDWTPRNFSRKYEGRMILKQALMKSVNSIAAQLVKRCGPGAVIETARRCGIQSPLKPVYSVALGTSGVSPLEMASAFATFATGGMRHEPFFIRRVEDSLGRVLEEHIVGGRRVLDSATAYQLVDMMKGVVDEGTGSVVRRLGFKRPAAGKTGTTNGYRDAWFTGFTPRLSVSVWVGFDRGSGMRDTSRRGITGGKGAAPIWADFMIQSTDGEPPREFPIPANIRLETVRLKTGAVDGAGREMSVSVALRSDQKADPAAITATDSVEYPTSTEPATTTGISTTTTDRTTTSSTITEEDLSPQR
jgi:penicillin-binding protein 1A